MHRLDRSAVPFPVCLIACPAERRYKTLHGNEKEEIRIRLLELQGNRCAYCERRTGHDRDDGHIEHFRSQVSHPDLDLAWTNMFWSCNDEKTCGKHKDKCDRHSGRLARFNPNDIIDPSEEDPNDFFLFVVDGTVRPHDGLDANNERRALETLRIFQLANSAYLQKSRQDALRPYLSVLPSLLSAGREHLVRYIEGEIAEISSAPFATPIRQYLERFLP
jgi:uncharacterized protein (TIGR02646 family)